jgi:glycine betaine/proline transport system permease protein
MSFVSTPATANPPVTDNEVLDEFTIPFGSWMEESVNWITLNLEWLLDAIAWPFRFLNDNFVEGFLVELPWLWLVGIMFLVALLVRNVTVAVGTAAGLVVCGLLGNEYWEETARTIGLILVAVLLCVVIGIPVGILAGRVDGVWSVLRPTLDAMQVIHSFVYLLPFIYFWGVGAVGATMATMIFALPPLIRLTNLGIRQVPDDVVEAARAYGAPERRVLLDVQLPLARPAIMTGINQTLLLAFSMLGVAAIMGAGGLGRLLFRAIGQQDVALGASSGLAFFILAVILDRIAQTEVGHKNLFARIATAWKARRDPEILLGDPSFNPALADATREHDDEGEASRTVTVADPAVGGDDSDGDVDEGRLAPVGATEQTAMLVAATGAALMVVSLLLTWAQDAALLTGYSRRDDQELPGESFPGWAAEGGSWFAFVVAAMGLIVIGAVVAVRLRRSAARWLSPDGALVASLGGLIAASAYALATPSPLTLGYSDGLGVAVAVAGGLLATGASLWWMTVAPYGPRRPLKTRVMIAPIVLAGLAVIFAVTSMFSSWTLDERADSVITPEIQAQLDEVRQQARDGEIEAGVAATQIQVIRAQAASAERIVVDGTSSDGPRLGLWSLVATVAGAAAAMVAAGATGLGERRQWFGGALAMGFGTGVTLIAVGWVGSLARATDPNFTSGVGSLIGGIAGFMLIAAGDTMISGFERSQVYRELPSDIQISATEAPESTDSGDRLQEAVAT